AISCFSPIPLQQRPRPPVLPDMTDPNKSYATCVVTKATYGADGIEPGEARFIRISHRLFWPYDNKYGGHRYTEKAYPNNWTPVRVIGTVPVESDGSAHFRVPADTPVYFQLLDENHMELRRMRSFISFQPGETRGCVGCHETREEAPASGQGSLALQRDPSEPIPPPWGERAISFLRDIQPILNRHCVKCHSGLRPAGGLDFCGGLTPGPSSGPGYGEPIAGYGFNRAFETIVQHKLVSWSDVQGDARITQPLEFGSRRSKIIDVLRDGSCGRRATLSRQEWLRLLIWIDGNAPYHDRFVNKRQKRPAYSLPADSELIQSITDVHKKRCNSCHEASEISRADWIDIHEPRRSLFLVAPLTKIAGGTQECSEVTYKNQHDQDYAMLLQLVRAAVGRAWANPRRDLKALLARSSD
ncbi:MAG: HzsA-related protein, partial [Planctomycetota bacterium]